MIVKHYYIGSSLHMVMLGGGPKIGTTLASQHADLAGLERVHARRFQEKNAEAVSHRCEQHRDEQGS